MNNGISIFKTLLLLFAITDASMKVARTALRHGKQLSALQKPKANFSNSIVPKNQQFSTTTASPNPLLIVSGQSNTHKIIPTDLYTRSMNMIVQNLLKNTNAERNRKNERKKNRRSEEDDQTNEEQESSKRNSLDDQKLIEKRKKVVEKGLNSEDKNYSNEKEDEIVEKGFHSEDKNYSNEEQDEITKTNEDNTINYETNTTEQLEAQNLDQSPISMQSEPLFPTKSQTPQESNPQETEQLSTGESGETQKDKQLNELNKEQNKSSQELETVKKPIDSAYKQKSFEQNKLLSENKDTEFSRKEESLKNPKLQPLLKWNTNKNLIKKIRKCNAPYSTETQETSQQSTTNEKTIDSPLD